MIREPVRATEAGVLRVQFTDSQNQPIQASGVSVNLYEPGLCPGVDFPTVSGLVPSYIDDGVFELEFTAQAPGGTWIDEWSGDILGSKTTFSAYFEVLTGGSAETYPVVGVCENNLIEVTLPSGIRGTSGSVLNEEFSFFFTTEYSPLYADLRKLQMEAGGILQGASEYLQYNSLLEASLEADTITFATIMTNDKLYQHARREYVACKAGLIIGSNLLAAGGTLKSKRLADFAVQYDAAALEDLLDDLNDKCRRWQKQVEAGGGARKIRDPRGVIKGELDPDRPRAGRTWEPVGRNELPVGNVKRQVPGGRRFKKGYRHSNINKSIDNRYRNGRGWDDF